MNRIRTKSRRTLPWLAAILVLASGSALGQLFENTKDPFLLGIPYPRVRLLHSRDASQLGTSADLRARDPFLFYQTGRDLLHRQFKIEHGALGRPAELNVPLYVSGDEHPMVHGAPARFARDHAASCGMCHSSVYREPSAGQTISSTGALGRNTTHFYGAGLVEMVGEQVTAQVLHEFDRNRNGWIDRAEAAPARPVRVRPTPESEPLDMGSLAPGADGVPQLNTAFRLWFVDAQGKVLADAFGLDDPRAAGFGLAFEPFGWGRGRRRVAGKAVSQGAEAATLREFYTVASDVHMGLQARDPVQQSPDAAVRGAGGRGGRSLNGAQQYDFGGVIDPGTRLAATGLSLDDPDGDGVFEELTEGDVDAVEFYLLHTPAPAVRPSRRSEEGRKVLAQVGCTRCHVEDWRLEPRNEEIGLTGDRRLFRLETRVRPTPDGGDELIGLLVPQYRVLEDGRYEALAGAALVERVYSDFLHHDIGPGYHERRWDGSLQTEHRTAPLWGIATTAPFGHSGQYVSVHEAIAAHGGSAQAERDAYLALKPEGRELLLAYLGSLVLYATDQIPSDIDGDGIWAEDFEVAGSKVGFERFDARFLMKKPPQFEPVTDITYPDGRVVPLRLITNTAEAFGLDLVHRLDSDGDGYPDVLDPLPQKPGVQDEPSAP